MTSAARETAEAVGDSPVLQWGARFGYAASGLLHLVMGWITLELALGWTGQSADQTGALANLAGTAPGRVMLWVVAIAFALLAVWQATEALVRRAAFERLKALGKFGLYAFLAFTAVQVVEGRSSGSGDTKTLTASLMTESWGRVLIAAVGLAVVGVGVYHVIKGARKKFLQDLQEHPGTALVRAAQVGYIAKGIALGLVGGLFVAAAVTADPEKAEGLDGALRSLKDVPAGQVMLVVIALGLVAYGVYSFGRARFARV